MAGVLIYAITSALIVQAFIGLTVFISSIFGKRPGPMLPHRPLKLTSTIRTVSSLLLKTISNLMKSPHPQYHGCDLNLTHNHQIPMLFPAKREFLSKGGNKGCTGSSALGDGQERRLYGKSAKTGPPRWPCCRWRPMSSPFTK